MTVKRRVTAYALAVLSFLSGIVPPIIRTIQLFPLTKTPEEQTEAVIGTIVLIAVIVAIPFLRLLKRMKSPAPWVIFTVLFLILRAVYPIMDRLIEIFGLSAVSFFVSWVIWQIMVFVKGGRHE